MQSKDTLQEQVENAAREQGMSSVLLRNAASRKLGLNITDMECLSLLTIRGIATPKELASYTGMTPGSATAMIDRLERAHLIKRTPNPNDRRGMLIEINKESMGKVAALFTGAQQAHRELFASYSTEELAVIVDFLTRFTENIKNQVAKIEQND